MLDTYIYIIIFFVLGTIMGSFYNVVGYRLPQNMSIITPPSHCPTCNSRLRFFDLIPILSYLIRRGKCKYCGTKIPLFYPFIEFITGILFVTCYLIFGFSMELMVALTFSSTLLIVMLSDYKFMIIPDELLIFSGILILIERILMTNGYFELVLDLVIPFLVLFLIKLFGDFLFKKESLGGGDIKLVAIFGLVIGWQLAIFSVFVAAFIALPISLIILWLKKTNVIPFGPFLSLSALIIYFLQINIDTVINVII